MWWLGDHEGNSTIEIKTNLLTLYTSAVVSSQESVISQRAMDKRYLRPVYPIIEIQLTGYGVSDSEWNANSPNNPKLFEVDFFRVSQRKDKRFATIIDEFFTLDNMIRTEGIRKAEFNYPNVEGINYGKFCYGGQPVYEDDLLVVDETFKTEQQSVIYKAKNLRGVYLLAYFEPETGIPTTSVTSLNTTTGLPNESIHTYAENPNLDFTIECAESINGSWTSISFDARTIGNANSSDSSVAMHYEKIVLPEITYNYVKVNFPVVNNNWNKILLSKVVLTRYEGTDYADYKMEGEI